MEPLTPKEEYEMKRTERDAGRQKESPTSIRKVSFKKFLWWLVGIIVVTLLVYGVVLWARGLAPQGADMSVAITELGRDHIIIGATHEIYSSNPPTSGSHYAESARGGYREEAPADEHIVHSLEHGFVWISYKPTISEEIKKELQSFGADMVIITERAENDTDIALAAWGRLDAFNLESEAFDENRVKDFIKRYLNKGPERLTGPHGGV